MELRGNAILYKWDQWRELQHCVPRNDTSPIDGYHEGDAEVRQNWIELILLFVSKQNDSTPIPNSANTPEAGGENRVAEGKFEDSGPIYL